MLSLLFLVLLLLAPLLAVFDVVAELLVGAVGGFGVAITGGFLGAFFSTSDFLLTGSVLGVVLELVEPSEGNRTLLADR